MGNIIFLAGLAGAVGGFCLLVYQALMYLMHDTWTQYTLYLLVENGPEALQTLAAKNPDIGVMLDSCPMYAALIVLGLILLLIGSKLRNRYS
jgi:hypothetical protein